MPNFPALFIKICGLTSQVDAEAALAAGATVAGVIFAPGVARAVSIDGARAIRAVVPRTIPLIGVFMDQSQEEVVRIATAVQLDALQLHGSESPKEWLALGWPLIKRVLPHDAGHQIEGALGLVDPGTGSGRAWDYRALEGTGATWVLSGGLTPDNVAGAIAACRPRGVDVSSGVEESFGNKSEPKMHAFVEAARTALLLHSVSTGRTGRAV